MNVEGMTRENVASHLQKYRQYLKRMAGYPANVKVSHDELQKIQQVEPQDGCIRLTMGLNLASCIS